MQFFNAKGEIIGVLDKNNPMQIKLIPSDTSEIRILKGVALVHMLKCFIGINPKTGCKRYIPVRTVIEDCCSYEGNEYVYKIL